MTGTVDLPGVSGRTVVITGAAGGIGRATGAAFVLAGARVFLTDVDPGVLSVAEVVGAEGAVVDIADSLAVQDLLVDIDKRAQGIDVVIHTAGILTVGSLAELTDEDWDRVIRVNATGTMVVMRAAARLMTGPGSITVVSSNAASTPRFAMAAYAASKAAASALVRSAGLELAARGIRCNIISPGSTDTAMLRGMWAEPDESGQVIAGDAERFRLGIPLGRLAQADDIAQNALFLASDAARHITLHDLRVDGGATLDM